MNLYKGPRKGRSSSSAPAANMILPNTSPNLAKCMYSVSAVSRAPSGKNHSALRCEMPKCPMKKFEHDTDNSVASTRLVSGERDSHRGTEDEEHHQRQPILCSSLFQVVVVRDDHMPRLRPVSLAIDETTLDQ